MHRGPLVPTVLRRSFALVLLTACATSTTTPTPTPTSTSTPNATPTPTPTPTSPLIVWQTGNGWTTLTVERDGTALDDFHPWGPGVDPKNAVKRSLVLSRGDLDALASELRARSACSIRATSRAPVPEEGPQSLTLDLPGLACTVTMLANDWSSVSNARPVAAALDTLTERVRKDGR